MRPATVTATSTISIRAPIQAVWEIVADPVGQPRWVGGLSDVVRIDEDDGPLGVGCRFEGRFQLAGFGRRFVFQITEWLPPHRFAVAAVTGPLPFETVVELESEEDEAITEATKWIATPGSRLASLVVGALAPALQRVVAHEVTALRDLAESALPRPEGES